MTRRRGESPSGGPATSKVAGDGRPAVDCVFCDIVVGKAPASVVYQDELVMAIMTIGPVTPGHLMVLPKRHYPYMRDMDEETGMRLFKVTLRMERAIRESGVRCEGIDLFLADGEAAFQEVLHLHMHVFPRFKGDSFRIEADWSVKPPRDELDSVAQQIRRANDSRRGGASS
ncbi:MAG: HIT family protein [Dehalococcoidia bacterium]|nr:HIT family protein [Dehalococcoidia bacterium]